MKHTYDLRSSDGISLYCTAWIVPEPKATVLIMHGYAEHIERYNYEASVLNAFGYSVFGYDQRAHGRSEGQDCYINNFDDLCDDLKSVIKYINPQTPFFIHAHSVGALVTIKYLLDHHTSEMPKISGLITTSAALQVSRDLSPMLQKVSGILGRLTPRLKTISLPLKTISHVAAVQEDYENDPYNYRGGIYASAGYQILKTTKEVSSRLSEVSLPLLAMHGGDDKLIEKEGTDKLYNKASSTDKTIKIWDGLAHEITRSADKADVFKMMTDWIQDRLTKH